MREEEVCQICGELPVELTCPLCGNEMCGQCTTENEEYDTICTECMNPKFFEK